MLDLRFHHVGIGTTDFDGAIDVYCRLGHRLHSRVDDPGLNVRVAFLRAPGEGGPWIEILAPLAAGGPLDSLIARKALPSPYHTCYSTTVLEGAAAGLVDLGFAQISKSRSAVAFGGARVAFFYSGEVGMLELVENPPDWSGP